MAKWEELNMDCLVNILARVGVESLLLDVPYVCKSWYKATSNPQCWSILDFTKSWSNVTISFNYYDIDLYHDEIIDRLKQKYELHSKDRFDSFIKTVLKRGNRFVTLVKLPSLCTQQALVFISNECPNLKTLKLPRDMGMDYDGKCLLPSLVSNWKYLEKLSVPWCYKISEILEQVSIHCNNFASLKIFEGKFSGKEAANSALVTLLPNLKSLIIRYTVISKENLLMILKCSKKLECLDVRGCLDFEETDKDIIKSATHIRSVKLEAEGWCDDFGDYCDEDIGDGYDYY